MNLIILTFYWAVRAVEGGAQWKVFQTYHGKLAKSGTFQGDSFYCKSAFCVIKEKKKGLGWSKPESNSFFSLFHRVKLAIKRE